jgi:hypothetical protein
MRVQILNKGDDPLVRDASTLAEDLMARRAKVVSRV